ncbi:hypothetical protein GC089_00305 [Cellulomonas sp. JZ18]|uniref:hypothetical protein n=1 Tax=Cellulomonas sp. JZ18 TaxID=2654191 RepID=UPI0012D47678|nr:hypothetical protein [Cellulomonas sp. JZ18]QGQ17987.1 hypothetical protein GC089_00305 [Cellulomonas sp. JZ18]
MRRRTRLTAVVVVAAMLATSVLAAVSMLLGGPAAVDIPDEGPWAVYVSGDASGAGACASDPAVVDAYTSLDAPSTRAAFVLAADAGRADVERVHACVTRAVPAGATVVVGTAPAAPGA